MSFAGISQKVAMAAAASGMALTVALPSTAAVSATEVKPVPQAADTAEIKAPADVLVDFARASLSTSFDPESRLQSIVAASDGGVTPAAAKGTLAAPMRQLVLTSSFGYRVSPITGLGGELHSGQDFGSSCGSAVTAPASGTVTFAGWHPYGGGIRVVIDHGNGLETTYNHLSGVSVEKGDGVTRGDLVAQSGTTGASTGCHLHFEVLVDGQAVDPLAWL